MVQLMNSVIEEVHAEIPWFENLSEPVITGTRWKKMQKTSFKSVTNVRGTCGDLSTGRDASFGPFSLAINEMGNGFHRLSWAPGKVQYILLMTDYVSKWVEAQAFEKVRVKNLKKRLTDSKGKWKEILPEVVCAYRTTLKPSTGETPFSIVYSVEALILVEAGEPSLRFQYAIDTSNDKAMAMSLDLSDERREADLVRLAAQKQRMWRHYNRRANFRHFQVGDLIIKRVTLYSRNTNDGNSRPELEKTVQSHRYNRKGSYQLESEMGYNYPTIGMWHT
uniref:Uncharacterized protein LOC104214151 n=1 Tax=Nicotiana sylvestris TaxID=4096 RepID=A0A1U7VIC9_NICSY|nr:PREDICTED: uncharacterized protein LOC104214151 [Nicotiana sylvestris]